MPVITSEVPEFLAPFLSLTPLLRLKSVGMNCGCEYTSFPRFRALPPYSRFEHSVGAALIVWHFTADPAQTLAALFHDIATPVFAHSIDFFRGDYMTQEATEAGTESILRRCAELQPLLAGLGLTVDDIKDYHRYPIADNDTPRLSADRLEYTLGNAWRYGFTCQDALQPLCNNLSITTAEDGQPEIAFRDAEPALCFARLALQCSRVYVAPEDRYAMHTLSQLLHEAVRCGVVTEADFNRTEPEVIAQLLQHPATADLWKSFRALSRLLPPEENRAGKGCVIHAKKRRIDPLVIGQGRVSELDNTFRHEMNAFLAEPQDELLCGNTLVF